MPSLQLAGFVGNNIRCEGIVNLREQLKGRDKGQNVGSKGLNTDALWFQLNLALKLSSSNAKRFSIHSSSINELH